MDDQEACQGYDPIDAAENYMRYIIARDVPGMEVGAAIVIAEIGHGSEARVTYAAGDLDMSRTKVEGMLYDSLRSIALAVGKIEGPMLPPPPKLTFRERLHLMRRLLTND